MTAKLNVPKLQRHMQTNIEYYSTGRQAVGSCACRTTEPTPVAAPPFRWPCVGVDAFVYIVPPFLQSGLFGTFESSATSVPPIIPRCHVCSCPESRHSAGLLECRRCAIERHRLVYSITSSARASRIGGSLKLSALAVRRLTTSSSLVGCSTGRSAGEVPLNTLLISPAALKYRCG